MLLSRSTQILSLLFTLLHIEIIDAYPPTSDYIQMNVAGWHIYKHRAVRNETIPVLRYKLEQYLRLGIPWYEQGLAQQVPIWIDPDHHDCRTCGKWYKPEKNPNRGFLKLHGLNPDKAGAVILTPEALLNDKCNYNQPFLLLHELAHAYMGLNPEVKQQVTEYFREWLFRLGRTDYYQNAQRRAMMIWDNCQPPACETVENRYGRERAYALTNQNEFFGVMSETFFGISDFLPSNGWKMRQLDPYTYNFMRKMWNLPNEWRGPRSIPPGPNQRTVNWRVINNCKHVVNVHRVDEHGVEMKQPTCTLGVHQACEMATFDGQLYVFRDGKNRVYEGIRVPQLDSRTMTCFNQPDLHIGPCRDSRPNCDRLARNGLCKTNKLQMYFQCTKSCNALKFPWSRT
ncbi:hypothetical protein K493DRAFT_298236 [Basidiobolus meristosporus CBS 931.73]|uniref:ShKT domain-containing protein n=1 Tax=Basidiobolus meristosporus CBS 931.73 TaxID=1314790 RepID=A0A1Y1YUS3_9FUNG|nr:hypothetical protein K493DRAFT_298236 [Basidiobolus meristosporus CBS 931.73]|eukprot:ORY01793.1 hypothetical protein K493DRAFT_298236 [Basidiobolus meristosporus CBS 931.73]